MVKKKIEIITSNIIVGQEALLKLKQRYLELNSNLIGFKRNLINTTKISEGNKKVFTENASAISVLSKRILKAKANQKGLSDQQRFNIHLIELERKELKAKGALLRDVASKTQFNTSTIDKNIAATKKQIEINKRSTAQLGQGIAKRKQEISGMDAFTKATSRSEQIQRKEAVSTANIVQKAEQKKFAVAEVTSKTIQQSRIVSAKMANDISRKSIQAQKNISKGLSRQTEQTELSNIAQMGMGQVFALNQERAANFMKSQKKMQNGMGGLAMGIRKVTGGMKGFRMEMLGVMFAGMSITRIVGSLMSKSLEWAGVWDVLSAALGILFLPIAMKLLDWALIFLDWVGTLSEEQKGLIGTITLMVGAFGVFLTVLGSLALGIGSLILVFGKLFSVQAPMKAFFLLIKGIFQKGLFVSFKGALTSLFTVMKGVFAALSAPVVLFVLAVIAIIAGMVIAWKENFMNMKQIVSNLVASIKLMFGGLFKIIKGIVMLFVSFIKGDFEGVRKALGQIFTGIGEFIIGTFLAVMNAIGAIAIGIVRVFMGIVTTIVDAFKWLWNKLVGHSIIPDIVKGIIFWFSKLPKKIWDFLKGIPSRIINGYKNIGRLIVNAFGNIGRKIADKFKNMIPDWMIKLFKKGVNIGGEFGDILGFQQGGIVPGKLGTPVPIIAHAGERVIPANRVRADEGTTIAPNITINANISSDYDVRRLSQELQRYWVQDFERVSQRRGI